MSVSKEEKKRITNPPKLESSKPVAAEKILSRYRRLYGDVFSMLSAIEDGLSTDAVFDLMQISEFSNEQIEHFLGKTIKTFHNYKAKKTLLDATTGEKVLKLFSLYDKGIEIFGTAQEFHKWLNEPAYGLGYKIPYHIMDSITGIELLIAELIKIEFGDLA